MAGLIDELGRLFCPAYGAETATSFDAEAIAGTVRTSWEAALFSEASNETLKRYFSRQLLLLCRLSEERDLAVQANASLFVTLIEYLRNNYFEFFDQSLPVPAQWQEREIKLISCSFDRCIKVLSQFKVHSSLKPCLSEYFKVSRVHLSGKNLSFRPFFFSRLVADRICELPANHPNIEEAVNDILLSLNFNYLPYLVYLQTRIAEALKKVKGKKSRQLFLKQQQLKFMQRPENSFVICQPEWPPIGELMSGWLEELVSIPLYCAQIADERIPSNYKLNMDIPASHLACWIRLFYQQGYFGKEALTRIFQFFAEHFSTKRQPDLSAGSLSKEYYSISQITAARVQQALTGMTKEINSKFFP